MKIRTLAQGAGILVVIGSLSAGGGGYCAFQQLKVGGPVYDSIVLTKDLIADVLPPPEYILEPYLEATLALNDPASAKAHQEKVASLKKDYDARHTYWEASSLDAALRDRLTRGAHEPAMQFWNLAEQSFFPALAAGDMNKAREAYGRMSTVYLAHRTQIDKVVVEATQLNTAAEQAAVATESRIMALVSVPLVLSVLLILGSAAGVIFCLVRMITNLKSSIEALAAGDLSVDIPYRNRSCEIGEIARAMEVFEHNLAENERLRTERAKAEQDAALQRQTEMNGLAREFESAVGQVVDRVAAASSQLADAAEKLTKTAAETQDFSTAVASSSAEASSTVRSVAAASEELAATVAQIGQQVTDSTRITVEAISQADGTNTRMSNLESAADQIGEVVGLISSVAEQTNLLALNATIEAARAGDAGKGFVVVAREVKALAAQTAKATEGIGSKIGEMRSVILESVSGVRGIGETIKRISGIASATAEAVTQQGAATKEIATNMHQAATGASEIASAINSVSEKATETGSASSQVLAAAQALSQESGRLKEETEKFLAGVRKAA
jgi:methyl-accepting chemotaxis protein